jgi:hypothetical protein
LYIYSKKYNKTNNAPKTPAQICYGKEIYTLNSEDERILFIEDFLGEIESSFSELAKLLNILEADEVNELLEDRDSDIFRILKTIIALQYCRNPANTSALDVYINSIEEVHKRSPSTELNVFVDEDIISSAALMLDDPNTRKIAQFCLLPTLLFNIASVHSSKWKVISQDTTWTSDFFCTDNPVYIQDLEASLNFNGHILMPLSKNKILSISQTDSHPTARAALSLLADSASEKLFMSATNLMDLLKTPA